MIRKNLSWTHTFTIYVLVLTLFHTKYACTLYSRHCVHYASDRKKYFVNKYCHVLFRHDFFAFP